MAIYKIFRLIYKLYRTYNYLHTFIFTPYFWFFFFFKLVHNTETHVHHLKIQLKFHITNSNFFIHFMIVVYPY